MRRSNKFTCLMFAVVTMASAVRAAEPRVHRDLAYVQPANQRQMLDIYAPAEGRNLPVAVWIHGGGWHRGDKSDVDKKPQAFVDQGFVFVSINYRLFPYVGIREIAEDVAKAIHWTDAHAQEYGGDPHRIVVMGHSAGAQLAALVCTDERYLKAEGLPLSTIRACVPVDGDSYDVPLQLKTVEEERAARYTLTFGDPKMQRELPTMTIVAKGKRAASYRLKFGDEKMQKDLSAVMHVAKGKDIPPFLVLHVRDHPETKAQSRRLVQVLREAGVSARACPAEKKDHVSINADLGLPGDRPTQEMFDFVRTVLGSIAQETPGRSAQAQLRVSVLAAETRQPVPCTVILVDSAGRTMTEGEGLHGGFRSAGMFTKQLPPGRTRIRVARGPECRAAEREVELRAGETQSLELQLQRQVDLRRRGWFSGDNHVHMIHGEKTIAVDFDQVALAARAEDLQYLSLAQAWRLDDPTPERLQAELTRRSTPDCLLTWNLEEPKNYFKGNAGRCLGHCWTLNLRGRTRDGADVIRLLLEASAADYESEKPSLANFEAHALIHSQGGSVFYTHPARWWTGSWGGQGIYPKREKMRVSNMAVELPLDVLAGPTFDGLDVITGAGEFEADQNAFQIWSLLLNHGYRVAATASSDACFDRPGGAVPGTARLYTFVEGDFSLSAASRAACQGRTFVTTGPLLVVSVDGKPPGTSFPAGHHPHELQIEAWPSGAAGGGLRRVEVFRNGQLYRKPILNDDRASTPSLKATVPIVETGTAWYCVRAFGADERRQRAISGAFFVDEKPWHPPVPVRARVRVRVAEAGSGRPLDASLVEVSQIGPRPEFGTKHRLPSGTGVLTIPATARLRAEAPGFEPATLSPLFDNPSLLEMITGLEDKDLANWRTYERTAALLRDVPLEFALKPASR